MNSKIIFADLKRLSALNSWKIVLKFRVSFNPKLNTFKSRNEMKLLCWKLSIFVSSNPPSIKCSLFLHQSHIKSALNALARKSSSNSWRVYFSELRAPSFTPQIIWFCRWNHLMWEIFHFCRKIIDDDFCHCTHLPTRINDAWLFAACCSWLATSRQFAGFHVPCAMNSCACNNEFVLSGLRCFRDRHGTMQIITF